MANWGEMINESLEEGEAIVACTLGEKGLAVEFDADGYDCVEGAPFAAWSKTRVFFPVVYDQTEWVGSAPRDPQDEGIPHQGGGC